MMPQGSERERGLLRAPQHAATPTPEAALRNPGVSRSEHYIYCHGELQPVDLTLTDAGAVCSCCGTLISWYVR